MASAELKVKNTIWFLRALSALILTSMSYWVLADLETNVNFFMMFIPFTYLFIEDAASFKSVFTLIVPLLVNIALWIPCYRSYVFLQVVLYIEYIKLCGVLVLSLVKTSFFLVAMGIVSSASVTESLIICIAFGTINSIILANIKTQEAKKYFQSDNNLAGDINRSVLRATVLLCLTMFAGNLVEHYLYGGTSVTKVETKELRYSKLLKRRDFSVKDKRSFIYDDRPVSSAIDNAKLSTDGRMLLIRDNSLDDDGKNLFIFDTYSMKNIKVLQGEPLKQSQLISKVYSFSPDDKYIIVGDQQQAGGKKSFQVLNIATGQSDERFNDPKGLSKVNSESVDVSLIEFSHRGTYFAVVMKAAKMIEIWDYISGRLVYTEHLSTQIESFCWISDTEFLLLCYKDSKNYGQIIYGYKISNSDIVTKTTKEKMFQNTLHERAFWQMKSSSDGMYLAIFSRTDGMGEQPNTISIWKTQEEKKISTIPITGSVQDMEFYCNDKRLIVLESIGIIKIWNVETGKRTRTIVLPKLYDNISKIKVLNNDQSVMLLGRKVHFISL